MAGPESISLSGNTDIDALLTEWKWDTNSLSFSFPGSGLWYVEDQFFDIATPAQLTEFAAIAFFLGPVAAITEVALSVAAVGIVALNGFEEFNEAQKEAARAALGQFSSVSGLTFAEGDEGLFDHETIRFAETASTEAPAFGIPPIFRVEVLLGEGVLGDTWFLNDGTFDAPQPGNYADWTIMHEVGHALGFKHTHESGLFGDRVPDWVESALTGVDGPVLDASKDSLEFTIMTYKGGAAPNGSLSADPEDFGYPQSLMMLDIQALQYMYGANFNHNSGDTTYSWEPSTGTMSINGSPQRTPGDNRVFMTIWDGNGTDTYDLSAYSTGVNINLLPGEWTITSTDQLTDLDRGDRASGLARGNVANALLFEGDTRSIIENAIGGTGDDTLLGNNLDNLLIGNAGNDSLTGLLGADTLDGGAGTDLIDGGNGIDTVSYQTSASGVIVNIDETRNYNNPTADLEPSFTINAGTATDGFGTQDTLRNLENIIGSQFNDILISNSQNNRILGLAGDDLLIGNAGNDYLDGGDGIDTVSYRRDPGRVTINLALNTVSDGFGGTDQIFNIENVVGSDFGNTIIGDDRDNTLTGGNGNDEIAGRGGNDRILGQGGNDTLLGEDGDDTLVGGSGTGWPSDILNGGAGNDTASYITATSGVAASLEQKLGWLGDATGDQFISIENLEGSNYDDFLIGDNGANILSGLAGNDTLEGRDGNDTLNGGEGNNILNAGEGNNTINAGSGNDTVYAGAGNDTISTNGGNDQIYAGDGNNSINAGDGNNKIYAGTGYDYIFAGAGDDEIYAGDGGSTIFAGAGNNKVYMGTGYDYISAGAGDDEIYAGNGGSTIFTGAGNNKVYAGTGYDSVYAEDGNDLISVGDGSSTIRAGNGKNTIYAGTGDDEVYAGNGDDEIHVGEGNNYIDAGSGKNTISAGSGSDVIYTGTGDDTIYAGEGSNTVRASDGNNKIYSGASNDFIFAGNGNDEIYAGEGQNYIDGGNGNNTIYSGASNDFILVGNGNDLIYAGEGNNRISAGNGNNTIYAGAGNDEISTGSGNDLIYAGEGNNLISTGTGFDTVYAGSGFDRFSLSEGLGAVTIIGFQAGQDSFIGAEPLSFSISGNDSFVSLSSSSDLLAIVKDVYLV